MGVAAVFLWIRWLERCSRREGHADAPQSLRRAGSDEGQGRLRRRTGRLENQAGEQESYGAQVGRSGGGLSGAGRVTVTGALCGSGSAGDGAHQGQRCSRLVSCMLGQML